MHSTRLVQARAMVDLAKLPSVAQAGADRGDHDDDRVRYPEGLDARQRRAWHD